MDRWSRKQALALSMDLSGGRLHPPVMLASIVSSLATARTKNHGLPPILIETDRRRGSRAGDACEREDDARRQRLQERGETLKNLSPTHSRQGVEGRQSTAGGDGQTAIRATGGSRCGPLDPLPTPPK